MNKGRFWLLLLPMLLAVAASAQLRLTAIPEKTVVDVNEPFRLQFVAEGGSRVRNFVPPEFRNFEQLGDVVETRDSKVVDGIRYETVRYTFRLKALVPGKLPIASAAVRMNDRLIISNPFIIVAKPLLQPAGATVIDPYIEPGEPVLKKINANLYVTAHVSKTRCVTGEPITATFKLYTRLDSESKVLRRSSFNGFSVLDLEAPERPEFTQEVVNGKLFNVYLIRHVQLIPLQSGTLTIDPVEVQHTVRLIRRHEVATSQPTTAWLDAVREQIRSAESNAAHRIEETLVTRTPALTIQVTDPPQQGRPASFAGAVGRFALQYDTVTTQVQKGGSGLLRLRISGTGNLSLVPLPDIEAPEGITVFEATSQLQQPAGDSALRGSKIFDVPFTGAPGTYKLGPVTFSYYNPEQQQYATLQLPPVAVTIKNEAGPQVQPPATEHRQRPGYWMLLLPLLLVTGVVVWVGWQRKQVQQPVSPKTAATPSNKIPNPDAFMQQQQQAAPHVNEGRAAVRLLQQTVRKYAALCLGGAVFSDAAIMQALEERQQPYTLKQYRTWTQMAEAALYAPPGNQFELQELYTEARRTMELLHAVFGNR
ncbi:MAG: BatD family protein [Lacibacter sp.]